MLSKITDMKMCSVSLTACILSVTLHMYQYLHIYLQKHHKLTHDLQFSSLLLLRCILLSPFRIISRRERIFVERLSYLHLEIYGKL